MVAIIELDREDGGQVKTLSVELMEGAELLYDKIAGSRSWQPRWVINVLNELQSSITSVGKGFNGNWVSVFIRLGAKGKRQMFITTETHKVKCMHRFYLYNVSVELTIFNNVRSVCHVGHRKCKGACDGSLPFESRGVGNNN
jgi:hypothetical protein